MSGDEKNEPKKKEKSFLSSLVIPITTALVVGGTAPWWVDLIKGGEQSSRSGNRSTLLDDSDARQSSEGITNDDSVSIQGSGNTVNENSVIASERSVIQQNDGSGSNISVGGDLNINEPSEIPRFSGEIGSGSKSDSFRQFISEHDNEVVFLDVYITSNSLNAEDRRNSVYVCDMSSVNNQCNENMFTLLFDCDEVDYGGVQPPCLGINYRLNKSEDSNNLFSYAQGNYYLKGYWSVRANPGMWQGIMSTTLTPVDVQDAR